MADPRLMPATETSVHDWLVVIDQGCYSDRQIIGYRVPEWQARKLHELNKAVQKLIREGRFVPPDGGRSVEFYLSYSFADVRLIVHVPAKPIYDDFMDGDDLTALIEEYEGHLARARVQ